MLHSQGEDEEFCSILDLVSGGCRYFVVSDGGLGVLPGGFGGAEF
jgi:hypothetical protein